ncbi:MAG: PIN domain nuclease [Proteobacteria bacterium]|nr:PIN domain nuclease [Pseudomonadota bacterium]
MIIADTSVWIDYFNGIDDELTHFLDSGLVEGTVAIGDLIFLKILQGFRNDKDYRLAKTRLGTLTQYEMFGLEMVEHCAKNYRALRKKGITIRKTSDVIIATFCIDHKMALLFSDKDFVPFVDHLGLTPALRET